MQFFFQSAFRVSLLEPRFHLLSFVCLDQHQNAFSIALPNLSLSLSVALCGSNIQLHYSVPLFCSTISLHYFSLLFLSTVQSYSLDTIPLHLFHSAALRSPSLPVLNTVRASHSSQPALLAAQWKVYMRSSFPEKQVPGSGLVCTGIACAPL